MGLNVWNVGRYRGDLWFFNCMYCCVLECMVWFVFSGFCVVVIVGC